MKSNRHKPVVADGDDVSDVETTELRTAGGEGAGCGAGEEPAQRDV